MTRYVDRAQLRERWRAGLAEALTRRAARVTPRRIARCGTLYEPERLHALRIALKKLRYVIELADATTGLSLVEVAAELKHQQRRSGRLHDRQILLAEVRALEATDSRVAPGAALVAELLECDCRRWHGGLVQSLGQVQLAVDHVRRVAGLLDRSARPRPARARLDAGRRRHAGPAAAPRRRQTG